MGLLVIDGKLIVRNDKLVHIEENADCECCNPYCPGCPEGTSATASVEFSGFSNPNPGPWPPPCLTCNEWDGVYLLDEFFANPFSVCSGVEVCRWRYKLSGDEMTYCENSTTDVEWIDLYVIPRGSEYEIRVEITASYPYGFGSIFTVVLAWNKMVSSVDCIDGEYILDRVEFENGETLTPVCNDLPPTLIRSIGMGCNAANVNTVAVIFGA